MAIKSNKIRKEEKKVPQKNVRFGRWAFTSWHFYTILSFLLIYDIYHNFKYIIDSQIPINNILQVLLILGAILNDFLGKFLFALLIYFIIYKIEFRNEGEKKIK